MNKDIVILTKSSKFKEYCVAGVDIETGKWIRLVSDNEETHGALCYNDIKYQNGQVCRPLDVVSVDVKNAVPSPHQPENVLINSEAWWVKLKEYNIYDILRIHPSEKHKYLFGNLNYYVSEDEIDNVGYSLTLIEVSQLVINQVNNSYGKPKTKASFQYCQNCYSYMAVTDPDYYSVKDNTMIGNAILVVSLPEIPFPPNEYFKFVARIFPLV